MRAAPNRLTGIIILVLYQIPPHRPLTSIQVRKTETRQKTKPKDKIKDEGNKKIKKEKGNRSGVGAKAEQDE